MSQWTHVLGIIRFENLAASVWPEPPFKEELLKEAVAKAKWHFEQVRLPGGSEGPLEITVTLTNRGETVIITGDLRDFGKEDLPSIVDWINDRIDGLFLRDGFIRCEVEFDGIYHIENRNDHMVFELHEGPKNENQ